MNILLLNPPGKEIYIRDYYCSKVSKSDYLYPPTDFLIMSGILSVKHQVDFLDAIADKLSLEDTLRKIKNKNYEAVIFLTGSVSWPEDVEFLNKLKNENHCLMIGTGDILLENPKITIEENDFLDAIVLDFTSDDILRYLSDQKDDIDSIVFRNGEQVIDQSRERVIDREFSIPLPRHDLFLNKNYHYPFVIGHPFAVVLTDYGCPFRCKFCVMSTIGFKYRPVEDIKREVRKIKEMGFKDIYFNDQTLGSRRDRLKQFCDFMISEKMELGWVCWSRVDLMSEETLRFMKKAGCHTILFGVESANDEVLNSNHKGFTSEQIKKTFLLCHKIGIRTLGTFIFGLPGESRQSCLKTIEFAKEIKADFASFNILIPRMHTAVRQEAIESGWVEDSIKTMDQSGSFAVMGNDKMSAKEIMQLRDHAIKSFYFRPSYVFHRLVTIKSYYELKLLVKNAFSLFKKILKL